MTREFKFSNGDTVREKITGFSGIITGIAFYLTGSDTYLITGQSSDGKEPIGLWYDEGRIELISSGTVTVVDVEADDNGSDMLPNVGRRGN